MTGSTTQRLKRCVSCGGDYFLVFFRPSKREDRRATNLLQSCRDQCIGCETRNRKEAEIGRRYWSKAKAAMRRHAEALKAQGKISEEGELGELYGWSLTRMVEDIKKVLKEGCPYCLQRIDEAEQQLRAVTLDIFDPQKPPLYLTNVRWCCARCNSEKQRTSPEAWGSRITMWHRWRQHQERLQNDPEAYGFLALNKEAEQPPLFWY